MKTTEVLLAEAQDQIKALTTKIGQLEESAKAANVKTAKTTLESLIKEAKLPAPAVELLNTQFANAEKVDGMKEAVEALSKCITESRKIVKNNGANDQGANDGTRTPEEVRESTIKTYVKAGYSQKEAELMSE